jgi:superfamily II DNA or RNA helicase
MASPLPFQLPSLARHTEVLRTHDATLEASVPGFGKTYVAGFLAQYLKRRPAVICPKSVVPHWRRALAEVGVEPVFVTNYEQAKLERFPHGRWAIKGRQYEWNLPPDALLVFDEVHRCADRTTQNAKLLVAAARGKVKTFCASATVAKDPLDLYALGLLLGLHRGVDFMGWCFGHGVVRGRFAFEFRGGTAALAKLHKEIFPEHGYRATYEDIPGFPQNTILTEGVEVENPSEIDAHFERVLELEVKHAEATEPIVARLRARQIAELQKADAMAEMARDAVREGQSVVIFVNFLDTLELILKKLKGAEAIHGGQNEYSRQFVIDNFQHDRTRVLVIQIQAGGTGISLHDLNGTHPRLSLISPPDSARGLIQALGRIHRAGAKSPAIQKIVFAEGTVEARVKKAVERKVNQIDTLNDGDLDPNEALMGEAARDAVRIFNS